MQPCNFGLVICHSLGQTGEVMKKIFGTPKLLTLLAIVAAIITAATFAAPKTGKTDASQHGIRLVFGLHGNKVAGNRDGWGRALDALDDGQYNVLHDGNAINGKQGRLKLVKCTDVDTGGPTPPPLNANASAGGVNVTQQVSFYDMEELQTFMSNLASPTPTPKP